MAIRARRWLPSSLRQRFNLDGLAMTSRPPAVREGSAKDWSTVVLAGCSADAMEGRAMSALQAVANKLHHELAVERQRCCGALAAHLGHADLGTEADIETTTKTYLAINSGCLASWQQHFGATKVVGTAEWLDAVCAPHAQGLVDRALRIALHLPCTQQAQVEDIDALRRLIGRLPGASVVDLPPQPGCCGAAGTYFLNQPAIARRLSQAIGAQIGATGAEVVVSSNGACRAQLAQALFDAGSTVRVLHPAELVDEYLDHAKP